MDNIGEGERFAALPLFVAVIECGSFAAAGRKLGLSKSAVSKRILQLEARLGVRLLQRTTRRLHLTEAGTLYHGYARRALSLAREGEDAIARLQSQPRGLLRISVPMVFGRLHLSPLAPEFLAAHPGVQLDMQMDDRMVDLVEGGFDLAIRIGHLPESSLIARRIASCRSVICAAPAYLARHGRPETPAELAEHNCLRYAYYRGGAEWTLQGPDGRWACRHAAITRSTTARRCAMRCWLARASPRCPPSSSGRTWPPAGYCPCWSAIPCRCTRCTRCSPSASMCRPRCGPSWSSSTGGWAASRRHGNGKFLKRPV